MPQVFLEVAVKALPERRVLRVEVAHLAEAEVRAAGVEELAGALEEDFRCLSAFLGLLLLRVHDFLGHADDLDHRGRLGCLLRCVSRINVLILKLDQLFLDVYWGGPTFVIVKALLGVCPG